MRSVYIHIDENNGKSKGFATMTFEKPAAVAEAKVKLNGIELHGKKVVVVGGGSARVARLWWQGFWGVGG